MPPTTGTGFFSRFMCTVCWKSSDWPDPVLTSSEPPSSATVQYKWAGLGCILLCLYFHLLWWLACMAYVIPSPLYRMGEGLLGLPPISCYTMIKNSVNKYTDSLAIVDRDRQEKSLIIFCIFTTFLQLYVTCTYPSIIQMVRFSETLFLFFAYLLPKRICRVGINNQYRYSIIKVCFMLTRLHFIFY